MFHGHSHDGPGGHNHSHGGGAAMHAHSHSHGSGLVGFGDDACGSDDTNSRPMMRSGDDLLVLLDSSDTDFTSCLFEFSFGSNKLFQMRFFYSFNPYRLQKGSLKSPDETTHLVSLDSSKK